MTNEEASEKLKEILFMTGYKEALNLAIKTLEEGEIYTFDQVQELVKLNHQFAMEIENLKRPKGEWLEKVERRGCFVGDKTVYSYTCPFCGVKEFKKYPFCHCGADMREDTDDETEDD